MKTTQTFKQASTHVMSDKAVDFSISSDGAVALMANLSKLYVNPPEAVYREMVANAMDATDAAGVKTPVRISFLTGNPVTLSIQDFGTGMSRENLVEIYAKYGESTKRKTNKQRGGFGFGAKSALAITDRFDVISVKDGKRTHVYIQNRHNEAPFMDFVSETITNEPNGTTVLIPLDHKDTLEWVMKNAHTALIGYEPSRILVEGSPIKNSIYGDNWLKVNNGPKQTAAYVQLRSVGTQERPARQHFFKSNALASDILIRVGGVLYGLPFTHIRNPFPFAQQGRNQGPKVPDFLNIELGGVAERFNNRLNDFLRNPVRVVLDAPVGSVEVTPARDSLVFSEATYSTIRQLLSIMMDNAGDAFQTRLNKLPISEAYEVAARNQSVLPHLLSIQRTGDWVSEPGFTHTSESHSFLSSTLISKYASSQERRKTVITTFKVPEKLDLTRVIEGRYAEKNHYWDNSIWSQLLIVGVKTQEDHNIVTRNLRDYALYTTGNKASVAYLVNFDKNATVRGNAKAISEDMELAFHGNIITLDELVEGAKAQRRIRAQNAQSGVVRGKAKYPVYVPGYAVQEIETTNINGKVVLFDQESTMLAGIWNDMRHHTTGVRPATAFAKELSVVANGHNVVFLPSSKSAAAFNRNCPDSALYGDLLEDAYSRIVTADNQHLFNDLLNFYRTHNTGAVQKFSDTLTYVVAEKGLNSFINEEFIKALTLDTEEAVLARAVSTYRSVREKDTPGYSAKFKNMHDNIAFSSSKQVDWAGERYYTLVESKTLTVAVTRYQGNAEMSKESVDRFLNIINMIDRGSRK